MKDWWKNQIKNYILKNDNLNNIVISVYGMGSFSKKEEFQDIDLVFFITKNNYNNIVKIRAMIDYFLNKFDIYLDINVIDKDMINNNFLNSKLFIHRNRHSLILNELKNLNNLIYGKNILKKINYSNEDLMIESLKLTLTLRHTVCKLYMKDKVDNKINITIIKNARYSIENYLIFKGVSNPYVINIDNYINKYNYFKKKKKLIKNIYDGTESLDNCYNFIVQTGNQLKKEMLNIINNNISSDYYNISILKEKYEQQFR